MVCEGNNEESTKNYEIHLNKIVEVDNINESIIIGEDRFALINKKNELIIKGYSELLKIELIEEKPSNFMNGNNFMDAEEDTYLSMVLFFREESIKVNIGLGQWQFEKKFENYTDIDNLDRKIMLNCILNKFKEKNRSLFIKKIKN